MSCYILYEMRAITRATPQGATEMAERSSAALSILIPYAVRSRLPCANTECFDKQIKRVGQS